MYPRKWRGVSHGTLNDRMITDFNTLQHPTEESAVFVNFAQHSMNTKKKTQGNPKHYPDKRTQVPPVQTKPRSATSFMDRFTSQYCQLLTSPYSL
jgi:hypothetical protein